MYAVVGGETKLFPSAEIKKLKDIKEAGTKNKSSAWSRFSVTMTVPEGYALVSAMLAAAEDGIDSAMTDMGFAGMDVDLTIQRVKRLMLAAAKGKDNE